MSASELVLPITVEDAAILILFVGWSLYFWLRYTSKIIKFILLEGSILAVIVILATYILTNHAGSKSILKSFFIHGGLFDALAKTAKRILFHSM